MAKTRKKIQELADRMNFEMFVDGSKIRLRAKFEFSDGYRPSTIGLSTKEAYMYLRCSARNQSGNR